MRLIPIFLLPLILGSLVVQAQMPMYHVPRGNAGGDAFASMPTPSGAYSFRKVMTAYAGKPLKLKRASDSLQQDISFLGDGSFDTASATAFCNATTCVITVWYDQSGNGRDLVQPAAGSEPQFSFACLGASPCLRTVGSLSITGPSITPATGNVSFSVVSKRTVGTGVCPHYENNPLNRLEHRLTTPNYYLIGNGTGTILAPAANAQWHSGNAALNGAASYVVVDGATTSASVAGSTTAGTVQVAGSGATTCDRVEFIFWDNYALSAAEAAALNTNQHAYWGF